MDLHAYRLHLIGAGLVLLSVLAIVVYVSWGPEKRSLPDELSADFAPLPIPAEALFMPPEPDIIPKVLLSREPRAAWSKADAAPFWTDIGTIEQGPLEAAAEKEINSLFSSVP